MQTTILDIGRDWAHRRVGNWIETVEYFTPVQYCEDHRYLPEGVTSNPGPFRISVTPYAEEIINCFDLRSDVHEVNVLKGVQVAYSTIAECIIMYLAAHIGTIPICYVTADVDLSENRIKTNIAPMFRESDLDVIQTHDVGNTRKTGATKKVLQFKGGGFLVALGANSPGQMRDRSFRAMIKDEIEAWPEMAKRGKDKGDPDKLTDNRLKGYLGIHKILRGSTPVFTEGSRINKLYKQGDQRKYMVHCLDCGYQQEIRFNGLNKETGKAFGFAWDLDSDKVLKPETVRYHCAHCHHAHYEHDKLKLFSKGNGAEWKPTAKPRKKGTRSYHLPAFYSPIGARPWHDCVSLYLEAFDPDLNRVVDIMAYQSFYNDVLGKSFAAVGGRIRPEQVSRHRRSVYKMGEIPNAHAESYAGGPILFLTCTVDVHDHFLAIAIIGWTARFCSYLIDYHIIRDDSENGLEAMESPAWEYLRELIDSREYTADDGKVYKMGLTMIDSQHLNDQVITFCMQWETGVYPLQGRHRAAKSQKINEFGSFKTKKQTTGWGVTVDHYKDRIAPVLRSEWVELAGEQNPYHFNAPIDIGSDALEELTRETKQKKTDPAGFVWYVWHRPGGARNELWDCLVYAHAAVEILAYNICVEVFDMDEVDMPFFWEHMAGDGALFVDGG
jgi:phage terminase large subunit GpA-like protein